MLGRAEKFAARIKKLKAGDELEKADMHYCGAPSSEEILGFSE